MPKTEPIGLRNNGRLFNAVPIAARFVVLALLCSLPVTRASAQVCVQCPANAQAPASGESLAVSVIRNGQKFGLFGENNFVGECETVILEATLSYTAAGGGGLVGAGFTGGPQAFARITLPNGQVVDVMNPQLASLVIGPVFPEANACATAASNFINMQPVSFPLTPALAGTTANFVFDSRVIATLGTCTQPSDGRDVGSVRVVARPTCSIEPASRTVCAGASASFTVTGNGDVNGQPYNIVVTGPNGFSQTCNGVLTCAFTINNAQEVNEGVYTATITDKFGCSNTCPANLIVNPPPTCTIAGPDSIICPSTGNQSTTVYTSTVTPPGGTVTHNWTVSGLACATIQGPTTGPSVTVIINHSQCASGSFTLTDNITRDGCPGVCTKTVRVDCPSIRVWKQVVCYTNGVCEAFNDDLETQKTATGVRLDPPGPANCPAFCYRITVRNTGSVPLTLTVSDPDLNLSACGFPPVLAAGATAQCVVPAVTRCANEQNVVTATGVADQTTVTARDTNNVTVTPIAVACQLLLSTNGGANFFNPGSICHTVAIGNSYIIRISVSNPGQYPLQNVTVTNVRGLDGCLPSPLNLGTLAVSETKTRDCSFICTQPGINNYEVSVLAEASQSPTHICDFNAQGQRIRAQSDCRACVECSGPPVIEVLKEVACDLPGDACGTFSKVATGVKDSACPAFCYRVRITNTGPVPITSLTVTDPVLGSGNLGGFFGPLPIAPGDFRTHVFTGITHCEDTRNTVVVNGRSSDGQTATDQDSADARVLFINIVCALSLSATNDADGNPNDAHVLLPGSGTVQFTVTLTNTGTSTLRVVAIDGLPALVDCATAGPVEPSLPMTMGPGQSAVFTACTAVSCPAGAQYNLTVRAEADDQNGTLCVYDQNGNRIGDQTTCPAVVECAPGAGCTPGFWKNCTIHWQLAGYTTGQRVRSVFNLGGCCNDLGNATLRQALDWGGGSSVCEAAQHLLRAGVAALLNASSPEVGEYPLTPAEVIASVNAAFATCRRGPMVELAGELGRANSLGCKDDNGNSLPCQRLTQ
jgi:hypothetical protein